MGVTKSEIFTLEQNQLAQLAKALGHPARIAILQYLAQINACIGKDLVEEIGLAQATISQHLRELKNANLVLGNVEGTSICYCINKAKLKEMETMLAMLSQNDTNCNTEGCC